MPTKIKAFRDTTWTRGGADLPIWQALFEEPIRHDGVVGDCGCNPHIDAKVSQREQHFAVGDALPAVGDQFARF